MLLAKLQSLASVRTGILRQNVRVYNSQIHADALQIQHPRAEGSLLPVTR